MRCLLKQLIRVIHLAMTCVLVSASCASFDGESWRATGNGLAATGASVSEWIGWAQSSERADPGLFTFKGNIRLLDAETILRRKDGGTFVVTKSVEVAGGLERRHSVVLAAGDVAVEAGGTLALVRAKGPVMQQDAWAWQRVFVHAYDYFVVVDVRRAEHLVFTPLR
jgi:hypothetical protein